MLSRRSFLTGSVALSFLVTTGTLASSDNHNFYWAIADLEKEYGGRLGVAVLDTANGQVFSHRGRERFALCSTFKVLAAAFILSRVDKGAETLSRRIFYRKDQLVSYSPVTEKYVDSGMTVAELCKAAITHSDNTAANIMFDTFGGPKTLTAYLRSLGDKVTRLDRYEPDLNDVPKGELRDTTTPVSMMHTIHKLLIGDILSVSSRKQLQDWMIANTTGDKRLRAGLPKNWKIGDKTGSGRRNETNDVAILWPPKRSPVIVTVYYAESSRSFNERDKVIAEVGALIAGL